jgi:hypothetical protein
MRRSLPCLLLTLAGCAPDLFGFEIGPATTTETEPSEPGPVAPTECAAAVGAPTWSTALRWEWTALSSDPAYRHVVVAPVTADLAGDGLPEIAFVAVPREDYDGAIWGDASGYLVILDGATGQEILAVPDVYGFATRLVAADLDGDGDDEILASVAGHLAAVDLNGIVWRADGCSSWNPPSAADLDGDGTVEVVYGECGILDGATGQTVVAPWGTSHSGASYEYTELVDLDGDGVQEITLTEDVRDASGALVNALPPDTYRTLPIFGGSSAWSVAMGRFDVMTLDTSLQPVGVFDADPEGHPLICSADVDHDGEAELLFAGENNLTLRELDGAFVWSESHERAGGYPGALSCTVTDLDLDGCLDVVWPQNGQPRVYDAATGVLRTSFPAEDAATPYGEAQPVADLDGDGTLELVLGGEDTDLAGTWQGIRVYGETTGAWIGPGR